jgi:hypothetical protein
LRESQHKNFGIHRTTLLVIAIATMFGSFSVYKALGVGRTERSEVPVVASSVRGTALADGDDGAGTSRNPLDSAKRLTNVPRPALNTTLTPIEQIQVGDRVLAESPTGEEDTAFGSEIIPSDWRKLTLRAPKRDGTVAEVVLLRPLTWLNEQHGEVGGTVFISVPECGIDGHAGVLAIEACPDISSGAGRVVTGTFLHQARSTITLTIAGQSEPIECTGNHPFWSEDRQTFVRADSLQSHETLRTATGLTTIESWTPDLNPTPVYNIEVHGAHVYHVGTSGVVVHNPGGLNILDCPHGWLPEGNLIGLGRGGTTDELFDRFGALDWFKWQGPLTKWDARNGGDEFIQAFGDATKDCKAIIFSLDGGFSIKKALNGPLALQKGNYTAWEFRAIMGNDLLRDKTFFFSKAEGFVDIFEHMKKLGIDYP